MHAAYQEICREHHEYQPIMQVDNPGCSRATIYAQYYASTIYLQGLFQSLQ